MFLKNTKAFIEKESIDDKRPEFLIKWKINGKEHIKNVYDDKMHLK